MSIWRWVEHRAPAVLQIEPLDVQVCLHEKLHKTIYTWSVEFPSCFNGQEAHIFNRQSWNVYYTLEWYGGVTEAWPAYITPFFPAKTQFYLNFSEQRRPEHLKSNGKFPKLKMEITGQRTCSTDTYLYSSTTASPISPLYTSSQWTPY